MAFEAMGFEDLEKELSKICEIDTIAPDMLQAASPILEKELKGRVQAEANRGYATGDLAGSIKAGKPAKNQYGHYVAVTAKGKDRKGIRNNEKLAYLNYGTSKQAARPVIAAAVKQSEQQCLKVMQEVFDKGVEA